jgi:hypothetical protein
VRQDEGPPTLPAPASLACSALPARSSARPCRPTWPAPPTPQWMATSHLPTTAKDGVRTQGLTADRGHADDDRQMAPSPLANEITDGTTTSSTKSAPKMVATDAPRGFALIMLAEHTPTGWGRPPPQRLGLACMPPPAKEP